MYCRNIHKHFRTCLLSLILVFCLFLSGCHDDNAEYFYLDDTWTYAFEDSSENYQPISFSNIQNLKKIIPGAEGYVWLKNEFTIPESMKDEGLGLFLGKIRVAAEIWLNDEAIGIAGRMPPENYIPGNEAEYFLFQGHVLNKDGVNTLKIRLYVNGSGGILTNSFIASESDVEREALSYTFGNSSLAFGAACILLIVGVAYMAVWSVRKKTKSYLFYALMNLASAVYLSQFYVSELSFLNGMSYLTFSKIVIAISAFVTAYFATSFIRTYFGHKDSDNVFIIRISLLFVPSLIALCITDVSVFMQAVPFLYIFIVAQIGFAIASVVKATLEKSKDVPRLLSGFSPVFVGIFIDIIVHFFLSMSELPYFTVFGWQGVIIAFLIDLALRLKEVYGRLELLNTQLEQQVLERTKNLSDVNELLEKEQRRSNADIAMAEKVQRSFLIPQRTTFDDWEIAVAYQPLSGVSGDLYDIYSLNDALSGVSLFDVSGHGMAAGLVTMLSKNIIANQFMSGFKVVNEQGQPSNLSQVMYAVNNAIIGAKGDIENYLTGAIMRVSEDGLCEVVNAGNPFPMLNHDGQVSELKPAAGKTQMGMIGIDGFDVSFPTIDFTMDHGDSFLIFTDGLTESENRFGEQFGVSRLSREFSDCTGLSAEEQLDYIMHCHKTFTGSFPREDDLTVIIVHRK